LGAVADARSTGRQTAASLGFRELLLASIVVLMIGCAILLTVWRRVAFVKAGYEIRTLEKMESGLLDRKRAMEIEREMLSDPVRIEKIAKSRLGMTDPENGQIRIVQ